MRRYGTPPETLLAPSSFGSTTSPKFPGRGFPPIDEHVVRPETRAAVEGSTILAELHRWLARAATSASAEDVIDEA